LRRFLYAGSEAVMLEGVVERKTWLHDALSDLMLLVWHAHSESAARGAAMRDLARLERQLAQQDARLPDDGTVRLAFVCAELGAGAAPLDVGESLRDMLGRALASEDERPLSQRSVFAVQAVDSGGEP
jgi:hypothetical protein